MPKNLTYIAKTNFRNSETPFGIKRIDRRQHMYVIGKTGTGKTQFLKNMAMQDINNGQGLAIIDPHGEFVEEILDAIPPHRINDVVYFNPADMEFPVSFNIMDVPDPRYKHLIASGLIGIFTKIWANVWSARMEYILANCILALLDTPGTTLLGIPRMLVDRDYRQKIINNLKDPVVKSFWINEYEEWEFRYRNEAIAPVQNKVGQFLNVSFVRNIVGQAKNTIDIDDIMNNQKILLVNVSKGRIGEDNAAILGAMIITKIQLAAMERVRIPEDERKDFYMYVDEFQNFATDSFVNILSEARKYRLDLIIAHQYIGQLVTDTSTAVRDAVFGNVGTMISFRVGAADAEFLEQEFTPEFLQNDIIRLDNRNIYIKLMIDGITSRPFSGTTITIPPVIKDEKKRDEIIRTSRSKYAHKVGSVEGEINNWASNQEVPGNQNSSDFSNPQGFSKAPAKANVPPRGRPQADGQTTLYDAVCSNCGKDTKVIFPPTEGRPVYCKNCLKKIKSGEIQSASSAPERKISDQSRQGSGEASMPNLPAGRQGGATGQSDRPAQTGNRQGGDAALADLGIEFAPAPRQGGPTSRQGGQPSNRAPSRTVARVSPPETEVKIEDISFHAPKKSVGVRQQQETLPPTNRPVKRKEINLSELRKALEESLGKKEEEESELEERIEEEKEMDKEIKMEQAESVSEEKQPEKQEEPATTKVEPKADGDKKPLNPGEAVKF